MSRKHFQAIAQALADHDPRHSDTTAEARHRNLCRAIGNALAQTNQSFNLDRFLEACEP